VHVGGLNNAHLGYKGGRGDEGWAQ
jgi:hypothetical protein